MAIEEHDREDLLRDGRNMPLRGECFIRGVPLIVGFRSQGQMSIYCGADPVFQFNAERQLRRVYYQGRRFAADNGHLFELTRQTRGGKVEFESNQVDPQTQMEILSCLSGWLSAIRDSGKSKATDWRIVDDPLNAFRNSLLDWLEQTATGTQIANAPNA